MQAAGKDNTRLTSAFEHALRLHQEGHIEDAESIYRQILAVQPCHPGALHLLGLVRQQQGQYEAALELIGRAIALEPQKAVYRNNYGATLFAMGRHAEAVTEFQRALAIRPHYADCLANLGMAQAVLGQDAAALATFRQALRVQPGHPDAMQRLAAHLQRLGQGEEAIRLYEKALAESPSAELTAQFGKLMVLAGSGDCGAAGRLLFDGKHYYTNDEEGNRTSCYQKDARGNRFNLITYDWDNRRRLISVRQWDGRGNCTRRIDYTYAGSERCRKEDVNGTGREEGDLYDGRNPFRDLNCQNAIRHVAFISPHCLIDSTNGAATATLDGLCLLADQGIECQAFCGTRFDACDEVLTEEILTRRGLDYEVRNSRIGSHRGRMIFTRHGKVAVTLFNTAATCGACFSEAEGEAFLASCELFLTQNRPDAVWTYGGDTISHSLHGIIKRLNIPIVFFLHNLTYSDMEQLRVTDYVVAPSEFCRQHYRRTLGLDCHVLPLVVNGERVEAKSRQPRFLTFVNPQPLKGVFVLARIVEVLGKRRPDIPILLVEGAQRAAGLQGMGIDTERWRNVTIMPNTSDPRQFFAVTRVLLMPSLAENFGFVAGEAMFNGIPVVASNRGGLPDTIGDAGFLLEIPVQYTMNSRIIPSAEEVQPWIDTIIRLWDDNEYYDDWSKRAELRSRRWRPERLGPIYREFFNSLVPQPGPPLLP